MNKLEAAEYIKKATESKERPVNCSKVHCADCPFFPYDILCVRTAGKWRPEHEQLLCRLRFEHSTWWPETEWSLCTPEDPEALVDKDHCEVSLVHRDNYHGAHSAGWQGLQKIILYSGPYDKDVIEQYNALGRTCLQGLNKQIVIVDNDCLSKKYSGAGPTTQAMALLVNIDNERKELKKEISRATQRAEYLEQFIKSMLSETEWERFCDPTDEFGTTSNSNKGIT